MNFRPSLQCHFWPLRKTGQTETGESFAGFFLLGDTSSRAEILKYIWVILAVPTPFSGEDTISANQLLKEKYIILENGKKNKYLFRFN